MQLLRSFQWRGHDEPEGRLLKQEDMSITVASVMERKRQVLPLLEIQLHITKGQHSAMGKHLEHSA